MPHIQPVFRTALFDPGAPVPTGLQDGAGRPAHKRFDVYRNNVTVALIEALQAAFPVLFKLLGGQLFDQLAQSFVRAHPPTSPLMMHYGAEMPAFLTDFDPLRHIAYLPDVARLELAMRRSYHAADSPPFDPAQFGNVAPDVLMSATFTFSAAVEFVPSDWPIIDIWRFNTKVGSDKPRAYAQSALITRSDLDPTPHALSTDQAAWVAAVIKGGPLTIAQDAACAEDPNFDLTPLLTLLIQTNSFCGMTTPKE